MYIYYVKTFLIIVFIIFYPFITFSQGSEKKDSIQLLFRNYRETAYKLLIGFNFQGSSRENKQDINRNYAEIGLHRTITGFSGHHPASVLTYGLSSEVLLAKETIIGFKMSSWAEVWLFVLGGSVVYYTNFNYGNLKIRPEIGVGAHPFKLTLGYNAPTLFNKEFAQMRYADLQVTFNILLKLKTIKKAY